MGLGQEVNPNHAKSKKMSGIRMEFLWKPFTSRKDAAYEGLFESELKIKKPEARVSGFLSSYTF